MAKTKARVPASPVVISETPSGSAGVTSGRTASLNVKTTQIARELKKENLIQATDVVDGAAETNAIYWDEKKNVGTLF